jgi:hypothetical protein
MSRFWTLVLTIFAACIIAGLVGVLYHQLAYTICPEYYSKFKFMQFGLATKAHEANVAYPRIQVSIVGFMATSWVGIPMGIILGLFSLHRERRVMLDMALKAFLIVMLAGLLSGLYGLYDGFTRLRSKPRAQFSRQYIPENLVDFNSFIAVGEMHRQSLVGGFYGVFAGIAYIGWRKGVIKMKRKNTERA